MIGLPFERTKQDIINNINFCISLKPTYAMFSVLTIYPKTPLYYQAIEKKLIDPNKWEKFCLNPSKDFQLDLWEEFFTRDELVSFLGFAYKKFYLRLSYIIQSIKNLTTITEFKRKVNAFFVLIRK